MLRGNDTLPATIGIIDYPSLSFDYPPGPECLFVEEINPGLNETLEGAFGYVFRQASVVDTHGSIPAVDILASPHLTFSDPMKLTITFLDPRTGRSIDQISATRPLQWSNPGSFHLLGTDLLLVALVIVVPPLDGAIARRIKEHEAQRFNARFEPAIGQMVAEIALRASHDQGLKSFATIHQ